jgi:hypothetical protein
MMFMWKRPVPQFGGGGSSSGGHTKMTKAPNVTPSPTDDPYAANAGMFQNIGQQAGQFFPPAQGGQIAGYNPMQGPQLMPMQQLYGQGGPLAGIGAAINHAPQQYQAPGVNPLGQFFLRNMQ